VALPRSLRGGPLSWTLALVVAFGFAGEVEAETGHIGTETRGVVEVRLGHGAVGKFRWAVYAGRSSSSAPGRRPCIRAVSGLSSETGSTSGFSLCGLISRDTEILVAKSDGVGRRQRTVIGGAFPSHVRSVQFWLRGRQSPRIVLKRLGEEQAKETGLVRFRYMARAYAGPFCLRRFATYDFSGDVLRISSKMGCPDHSRAQIRTEQGNGPRNAIKSG
jgi:hypothetical protein